MSWRVQQLELNATIFISMTDWCVYDLRSLFSLRLVLLSTTTKWCLFYAVNNLIFKTCVFNWTLRNGNDIALKNEKMENSKEKMDLSPARKCLYGNCAPLTPWWSKKPKLEPTKCGASAHFNAYIYILK